MHLETVTWKHTPVSSYWASLGFEYTVPWKCCVYCKKLWRVRKKLPGQMK
jgi:hypothetical protein